MNAKNISDTKDFADESINTITVPICCTAEDSCYASSNLNNLIVCNQSETHAKREVDTGIGCDGLESCVDSFNGTNMHIHQMEKFTCKED